MKLLMIYNILRLFFKFTVSLGVCAVLPPLSSVYVFVQCPLVCMFGSAVNDAVSIPSSLQQDQA